MPIVKAEVKLEHKTGPVKIDITAGSPEVAAYLANRIKDLFDGGNRAGQPPASLRDLLGL